MATGRSSTDTATKNRTQDQGHDSTARLTWQGYHVARQNRPDLPRSERASADERLPHAGLRSLGEVKRLVHGISPTMLAAMSVESAGSHIRTVSALARVTSAVRAVASTSAENC